MPDERRAQPAADPSGARQGVPARSDGDCAGLSVAIVGAGRAGSILAHLLQEARIPVAGILSRTPQRARAVSAAVGCPAFERLDDAVGAANVLILAVPDDAIAAVAVLVGEALAGSRGGPWMPKTPGGSEPPSPRQPLFLYHLSGRHAADVLGPARAQGATVGSMHPLQTFADLDVVRRRLPDTYFSLEGDPLAVALAERLIARLGARSLRLDTSDKALYHAAACIASNYQVSLLHLAGRLLATAGGSEETARAALRPLVEATLDGIWRLGPRDALTGPIARGDAGTVAAHLQALAREASPEAWQVYTALGRYTAGIARERGELPSERLAAVDALFVRRPAP